MKNKQINAIGRKGLGTAGKISKGNKKHSARKVRRVANIQVRKEY